LLSTNILLLPGDSIVPHKTTMRSISSQSIIVATVCLAFLGFARPATASRRVLARRPDCRPRPLDENPNPELSFIDEIDTNSRPHKQPKHASVLFHTSRGGGIEKIKYLSPFAFTSFMAFMAGCSDVLCFQRFHCYAAMMTGNIVALSIAMAEQHSRDVLWRLTLIFGYLTGVIAAKSTDSWCQRKGKETCRTLAPVILAIFAIGDRLIQSSAGIISDKIKWEKRKWFMSILAVGYGIVYSTANQALNGTITNLLTGHLTKLGNAAYNRYVISERKWNDKTLESLYIIFSFILGGMCGVVFDSNTKQGGAVFTVMGILYSLAFTVF